MLPCPHVETLRQVVCKFSHIDPFQRTRLPDCKSRALIRETVAVITTNSEQAASIEFAV